MPPASIRRKRAAGQQRGSRNRYLANLPVEILIEIICHLDFNSFDNMLRVNRRLRSIIESYCPSMLSDIIEREFTPADGFFYAFKSTNLRAQLYGDKNVQEAKDVHSYLHELCLSGRFLDEDPQKPPSGGFHTLLSFCRVIRRWEMEFGRLRFSDAPEYSRSLHSHELLRLRQGLYAWWRYARYFHGTIEFEHSCPPRQDLEGYTACTFRHLRPQTWPESQRRGFIRRFSTTQLHEIFDMWETIRSAVGRQVVPPIPAVLEWSGNTLTRAEAGRIGWGDLDENGQILATVMKLRPEDILHLLLFRHRYATKESIVDAIRLRHPRIEDSIETFSDAIHDVLREREVMDGEEGSYFPVPGFPSHHGGILDHEEPEAEALRAVHGGDAGSDEPPFSWLIHRLSVYRPIMLTPPGRLLACS